MSRAIKFRGRRVDNGEWVYGYLHMEEREGTIPALVPGGGHSKHFGIWLVPVIQVVNDGEIIDSYQVDPATIGQFTGLLSKDGVEIYEGDICLFESSRVSAGQSNWWQQVSKHDKTIYPVCIIEWDIKRGKFIGVHRGIPSNEQFKNTIGKEKENRQIGTCSHLTLDSYKNIEVIGTVHTTPELLK